MVVVAVAGGTGNIGRTIRDAFQDQPAHKAVVLARKVGFSYSAVIGKAILPKMLTLRRN
jgi:aspartate-semialdehyde dehydrogenase